MEQTSKSLTHRGVNGYKQSSIELVQLADLGRRVVSMEQMKEKHRSRLHLFPQKRASRLVGLIDKPGPETEGGSTEQRATEKGKALSSR